jgi:hypothetical protein
MAECLRTGTLRFSTSTFNKAKIGILDPHDTLEPTWVANSCSHCPYLLIATAYCQPCLVSTSDSIQFKSCSI